jgi:beta-lactamase regulating signal transducer with metallopeptidase domain
MAWDWTLPATWLLRSAAGGGIVLLFAWWAMRRHRQPARRQLLGEWGVVAALCFAGLSLGPAWIAVPVPFVGAPASAIRTDEAARVEVSRLPSPDFALIDQVNAGDPESTILMVPLEVEMAPFPGALEEETRVIEPPPDATPAGAPEQAAVHSTLPPNAWAFGFVVIYAVGAVCLLGRWLLGYYQLGKFLRSAVPPPPAVARLFATMAREASGRPPRLLVSGRLRIPVSCGLFRPTVVLPAAMCAPESRLVLRWVFAHELTHLERRDAWSRWLFGLGQAVYFYVPWFWWLRRQVHLCQEFIADAAVVRRAPPAADYAQFLLSLCGAPAVPGNAAGVSGKSSDLFRRVSMLLQDSVDVESRCSWRWSLAAAGGLLALAVLASGVGLKGSALAGDEPEKKEIKVIVVTDQDGDEKPELDKKAPPKKEKGKGVEVNVKVEVEALQKALEQLRGVQGQKELDKARQALEKALQQIQSQEKKARVIIRDKLEGLQNNWKFDVQDLQGLRAIAIDPFHIGQGRLGVHVEPPGRALADQLDLPANHGMVITDVQADSAAAKAGIKVNDILVDLDGQAVPPDFGKFVELVHKIKADTPVDAVVLRKGKKEVIKGLKLPQADDKFQWQFKLEGLPKDGARLHLLEKLPTIPSVPAIPAIPGGKGRFTATPLGAPLPAVPGASGHSVMTTVVRNDDHFTTRHQEGSLVITLTGHVADSKATVNEIHIQDGRETHKYKSVDKVPDRYADKVKNLVEMSERGQVKVEVKTP